MGRLGEYIKSTRAEMKHVSWPTRSQSIWFTVIIIVFSLVVAAYLGALDFVFTKILELVV